MKSQLEAKYRSAWESGDRGERQTVLDYIYRQRKEDGFDILVEAIRGSDPHLAQLALGLASALIITYGFNLGPNIWQALEDFRRAFPEDSEYVVWVQTKIDKGAT